MANYNFDCNECKEKFTINCLMSEITEVTKTLECTNCKSTNVSRDFSTSFTYVDPGYNDPNSSYFWKKGKTTEQAASALLDETSPY